MTRHKIPACFAVAMSIVIVGCDFGNDKSELEQLRREKAEAESQTAEKESLVRGLEKYADAKLKLFEDARKAVAEKLAQVRADVDMLANAKAAVSAERNSKGEEYDNENRALRLMRHPDVNKLAVKHLAVDFSEECAFFIEKVKLARAQESRYNAAIRQSDDQYRESMKYAAKWVNASKEQREQEIKRLRAELAQLESRKAEENKNYAQHGKRTLAGGMAKERERRESQSALADRIADIDRQISVKRYQLDYLQNPNANRMVESMAAASVHDAQREAINLRERNEYALEKMKPKTLVIDVVDEYVQKTIGRLSAKLTSGIEELTNRDSALNDSILRIKDARLSIPVSTLSELKSLRSKLEKVGL